MPTETEIRAAFTAGTTSAVTPEAMATFKAQMESRGLDPSATLARHGESPSSQPEPQPKATPRQYAPDIDPATGHPRLTSEQTAQAAATLRKFWTGDPATLEAALAGAGAAPVVAEPMADTRNDTEKEFDNSTLAAPVDPAGYELGSLWVGREEMDVGGMAAMDRTIRSTMSELSVSKALGRATAEAFMDSASVFGELTDPVSIQRYHMQESATFAKVCRIGWTEASAAMRPWLEKMSPATRDFLAKGAIESAPARVKLWQSYQLATARRRMGGKS